MIPLRINKLSPFRQFSSSARHASSRLRLRRSTRLSSTASRNSTPSPRLSTTLDSINNHRLEATLRAHHLRRIYYAAFGALSCMAATMYLASYAPPPSSTPSASTLRNDAPASDPLNKLSSSLPILTTHTTPVSTTPPQDPLQASHVPTGTSTVPTFPTTIHLPSSATNPLPETEYTLLGLGVRTVSFLSIEVYVVGLYVATSDLPSLQSRLIHTINPQASALIPTEAQQLQQRLLGSESSEEIWDAMLRPAAAAKPSTNIRTAWRIVPTKEVDMIHLRDGWVRSITGQTRKASSRRPGPSEKLPETYDDEAFASTMQAFKKIFASDNPSGKKAVAKGKILYLVRGRAAGLDVWYHEGEKATAGTKQVRDDKGVEEGFLKVGAVEDERVGRLLWLGYLAGAKVASEPCRKSVVDGLTRIVARPVGTVGG